MVGYIENPVRRRWRVLRGRKQGLDFDGNLLVLPPDHDLPFYIRRDPTYDTYAIGLVRDLVADAESPVVIDIGANVGDTAIGMLSANPRLSVLSVEGSSRFVEYLSENLAPYPDRAMWMHSFVGPISGVAAYQEFGSTGGFQGGEGATIVDSWVSPAELLACVADHDYVIYKSDIDGFDIHVLAQYWSDIEPRCDVIWFEYDPVRTLGDRADIARLLDLLAASGRELWVYDNLGRRMFTCAATEAPQIIGGLNDWLQAGFAGHLVVPYLDIWAVRPRQSCGSR
ncbi:hypothetical protein [Ornithinimicrobium sp. Y1694]|uniref:hypothetical protein n=1 Tax=Ornithinimicrobium sp. Y1694 TaxID=3418590 RepID=UPI003CED7373